MPGIRFRVSVPLSLAVLGALQVLLLSGCAGTGLSRSASLGDVASVAESEIAPRFTWPDDARLRSAGYARERGLERAGENSPAVEIAELRGHFEFVIPWLESREEGSLEIALTRLEEKRGAPFLSDQRVRERERLRLARQRQIETLDVYATAGRFPLNTAKDGIRRPIFVDANGTACAVGHLMREDGWEEGVEAIRRNDVFVYLPDVTDGAVLAWVAASGLLHEEAAVIQPAYAPPSGPGDLNLESLAQPGASADASGLRLENFSATRTTTAIDLPAEVLANLRAIFPELGLGELATLLNLDLTTTETSFSAADLSGTSTFVGFQYYEENLGLHEGFYGPSSPFLFWNGSGAGGFLSDSSGIDGVFAAEIAFDVSVVESGMGIDAAAFNVASGLWGDVGGFGPDLELEMEVRSQEDELLATYSINGLNSPGGCCSYGGGFAHSDFAAQEKVSVLVRGSQFPGSGPVSWNQFEQSFRIVPIPEPTTALLLSLGLLTLAVRRRSV